MPANPHITMNEEPTFADAVAKAQQFAFGNRAYHFEGMLFFQAGRLMFSTAMPLEDFVRVAEPRSSKVVKRVEKKILKATEGDSIDDVAETTNRPIDRAHVRSITKYVTNAVNHGDPYIMPPATLNLRGERVTIFTLVGDSTIKPAILVLPAHARFEITDAQHRRAAVSDALDDRSVRRSLLRDGIAVMVSFENDLDQVHQDYADASKVKPIATSLVAVYDGRLPVNALAKHLGRNCALFLHTIDATSKGSSLSAGSVKVWNTNILRQFVKYAGLHSREGDDTWNEKFTQLFGEQGDPRYVAFLDYLTTFVDACTRHFPLFKTLAEMSPEDMSMVPKLRAKDGGQVLMTAPGMNILGALAHDLRVIQHQGKDIEPWIKKLASIDWSYEGAIWQKTLIIGGKISVSAKAVKDAIAAVEKQIGLESFQVAA
jgi:DNA sulfur modification protein DndB